LIVVFFSIISLIALGLSIAATWKVSDENEKCKKCPIGFFESPYHNPKRLKMCYFISTESYDWWGANSVCVSLGATLASIRENKEYAVIQNKQRKLMEPWSGDKEYWTGGRSISIIQPNKESDAKWIWSDGEALQFVGGPPAPKPYYDGFDSVKRNSVNVPKQGCTIIDIKGNVFVWIVQPCSEFTHRFVCEKKVSKCDDPENDD